MAFFKKIAPLVVSPRTNKFQIIFHMLQLWFTRRASKQYDIKRNHQSEPFKCRDLGLKSNESFHDIVHPFWSHPSLLPSSLSTIYETAWSRLFGIVLDPERQRHCGSPYNVAEDDTDSNYDENPPQCSQQYPLQSHSTMTPRIEPLKSLVERMHYQFGALKLSL